MLVFRAAFLLVCASPSLTASVSSWPPLSCSRQGLRCHFSKNNCLDAGWLVSHMYTPSSPEELEVDVSTRRDESGHLHPVLDAKWKIKDDGSISYLNATELHVLEMSTNVNLCVRYSFKDKLPMRSPHGEKWSFSADMVVVQPGQGYLVSVYNIPKPQPDHSSDDVSTEVKVPDCQDPIMRVTKFCIESGSLWEPDISVAQTGRSALTVSFSPDRLSEQYTVICKCASTSKPKHTWKGDQKTLNVTFNLDDWPRACCRFDVEIKPRFPQCDNDCMRHKKTLDVCRAPPTVKPSESADVLPYILGVLAVVFLSVVIGAGYLLCRKRGPKGVADPDKTVVKKPLLKEPPKVLIIYSHDHRLYKDIVLKLCAFLQAKCGTRVLVDLLDSASVGMVGRVRWLEWQRQKLNPSDKILVLCSRGVQAKWRAMCGQSPVTLREDVLSPTDDMITPFLSLFLPHMHQPGMLGKYMVAYFEDISCEQDIPSVFDIAVKYKLMKHFEELYFRILGVEKYQPGQVNHIEGIGREEYFNCPSGRDLRIAIETFQLHQLENPDWFELECVDCEEEVMNESNRLIDELQIPPVMECAPVIREGPPVYCHEVKINENLNSVHILTPELNPHSELSSVAEHTPIVNAEWKHPHPLNPDQVSTDHQSPRISGPESGFLVEPVLNRPPPSRQNWLSINQQHITQVPDEVLEELSQCQYSPHSFHRVLLLKSLELNCPQSSHATSMQSEHLPLSETSHSQPVEMEEHEVLETCGKRPVSGSDQGYISRVSSQQEPTSEDDPLKALQRLQEEQYNNNLKYSITGLDD